MRSNRSSRSNAIKVSFALKSSKERQREIVLLGTCTVEPLANLTIKVEVVRPLQVGARECSKRVCRLTKLLDAPVSTKARRGFKTPSTFNSRVMSFGEGKTLSCADEKCAKSTLGPES